KTVSFAIIGALIMAITYVPMMGSILLTAPSKAHHAGPSERVVQWMFRLYEPIIQWGLGHRKSVILMALGILAAGVFAFKNIGGEFIPKLAEGDLVIETNLPVGTSMTETIELSKKIQKLLLAKYPDEVQRVVSKIGTSEVPVDPMPMEAQEIVVVLKDKHLWTRAHEQEELVSLMAKDLEAYPGIVNSIQQPIENRVNELMSGARTDVVVKLVGTNLDTMVSKGNQIISLVKTVRGAADVQENKIFGLPQINIKYDRRAMALYGITVDQVNRAVQTAFAGSVAGTIYENDKRFDLTIRLSLDERARAESIENLVISDNKGQPLPLKQIARISEETGPSEIGHEDLQRRMNIGFNVRGRDLESVVKDAEALIREKVVIPSGYSVDFGGEFENFRRAKQRLSVVVPISLLIIFGLLFASFRNLSDSILIYTVVPLSAVGGVFSLLLRGMNFSISAGVGFIALFGIAVLNGILILNHFNVLEKQGIADIRERVLTGLRERFRPVLMTSAVAALGFLPMALSTSVGAEVQKPLATVVIGGLFTSTILTLLVLPVLYALFKHRLTVPTIKPRWITMLFLGFVPLVSQAQQTITMDSAVVKAMRANPEMELAGQKKSRQNSLLPATFNLKTPDLVFEAPTGHDLRPGILQVIDYPGIYAFQRRVQEGNVELADIESRITRNSLSYRVRLSYSELQYFIAKLRLLQSQDSIFDDLLKVNEVRYRVGQISNLERVNGESQYKRIQYGLRQTRTDLKSARYSFNLLLGRANDTTFLPASPLSKMEVMDAGISMDTLLLSNNPLMAYSTEQVVISANSLRLERSKRVPGLVVGVLNQGAPETGWLPRLRFGITLPLWQWTYQSQINAAKTGVEMARTQRKLASFELQTEYARAQAEFNQNRESLEYFETAGLLQSREILRSAKESFRLGSINYYAYLQNLELSFTIRQNYLETLRKFNQSVLRLQYLKGEFQNP
ncbi:MAG: efflux RND transporter permease subunit, partial [Cyclobacteriaceae bacterium]|nr:efflux RND transporter permease subunit [Cyclobacteriaceae bacterium]